MRAGLDVPFEGSETCIGSSPRDFNSVPVLNRFRTGARNLGSAGHQDKLSVMQPHQAPSVIAAMPWAVEAVPVFFHHEEAMEMLLTELMLLVGAVAVFAAVCTLENTSH